MIKRNINHDNNQLALDDAIINIIELLWVEIKRKFWKVECRKERWYNNVMIYKEEKS